MKDYWFSVNICLGAFRHEILNALMKASRRDGTLFANLLICASLFDDHSVIRYFIGCQLDITDLIMEGMGIESFRALLQKDQHNNLEENQPPGNNKKSWQASKAKESF